MKPGLAYVVEAENPEAVLTTAPVLSGVHLAIWQALLKWNKPYSPGYRDLMKLSGVRSTSSVHDAVKLLEKAGLVTVDHEARFGSRGTLRLAVKVE